MAHVKNVCGIGVKKGEIEMECRFCGKRLKVGERICPECKKYQGRTYEYENAGDEMFMTENRRLPNGGYTQQQQNVRVEYTNPDGDPSENPYDNFYYGHNDCMAERLKRFGEKNESPDVSSDRFAISENESGSNPYDDIFEEEQAPDRNEVNSEEFYEAQPQEKESLRTRYIDFISNLNIIKRYSNRETHSEVFVPTNVKEFARHMKVRNITKRIHYYTSMMVISAILAGVMEFIHYCLRAESSVPILFLFFNWIIVVLLSYEARKNYSKVMSLILFGYCIFCVLFVNVVRYFSFFTYPFIAVQVVLSLLLLYDMMIFYKMWDYYQRTGEIEVKNGFLARLFRQMY